METKRHLIIEEATFESMRELLRTELTALNKTTTSEQLLKPKDAAAFIGTSLRQLHTFSLNGTVKAYRLGKRIVLYKKSELIAALKPFKIN